METWVRLLAVLLWTGGSRSKQIFKQTGDSLDLHVSDSQRPFYLFHWKFNNRANIITLTDTKTIPGSAYKDRVEFFPQNLSLILKNVQLSDTGTYTAVRAEDKDFILSTFDVTVEAPVSAVNLSLDSVSRSPESCNFTVICTTELYSIRRSFTCDTHHCEELRPQTHGHAPSGFTLDLIRSGDSVICNHSNHVSWTIDTRNYLQMCVSRSESQTGASVLSVCVLKTVVYSVGLLLMLTAVLTVHVLEHRAKQD